MDRLSVNGIIVIVVFVVVLLEEFFVEEVAIILIVIAHVLRSRSGGAVDEEVLCLVGELLARRTRHAAGTAAARKLDRVHVAVVVDRFSRV